MASDSFRLEFYFMSWGFCYETFRSSIVKDFPWNAGSLATHGDLSRLALAITLAHLRSASLVKSRKFASAVETTSSSGPRTMASVTCEIGLLAEWKMGVEKYRLWKIFITHKSDYNNPWISMQMSLRRSIKNCFYLESKLKFTFVIQITSRKLSFRTENKHNGEAFDLEPIDFPRSEDGIVSDFLFAAPNISRELIRRSSVNTT